MNKNQEYVLLPLLLKRADFILSALTGILLLATFYYWLLIKVSNLKTVLSNISTEPLYFKGVSILVPLTLILFGLNFALSVFLLRAKAGVRVQGASLLGGIIGGFGAACPVCGAFLLTLVGITAGLSAFPLAGLEFWFLAGAIMAATFWYSLKTLARASCVIERGKEICWKLPSLNKRFSLALFAFMVILVLNLYAMVKIHDAPLLKGKTALAYPQCIIGLN